MKIHFSGVLALLSYGLFMSSYGKTKISPSSEEAVHSFWFMNLNVSINCFKFV